jgi:hypothetical protein
MKFISIQQPWAFLILHGIKRHENRTWSTPYRGPLLIHAGKREDLDSMDWALRTAAAEMNVPAAQMMNSYMRYRALGCIVGKVHLTDVVTDGPKPWFFGPYAFVLDCPIRYKPMKMRGALGIQNVPADFKVELLQEI